MSCKLSLSAFLSLVLSSTSALALTCANDYSGSGGCASNTAAAGDCETLGYSTDDVADCAHYLYCPFDSDYKKCVANENTCDYRGYPLDRCPVRAVCDTCLSGGVTKFRVKNCLVSNYLPAPDGSQCLYDCTTNRYRLTYPSQTAAEGIKCTDGNEIYYLVRSCKEGYVKSSTSGDCVVNPCSGYDLPSCLSGYECDLCQQGAEPYAVPISKYYIKDLITCGQGKAKYYMSENYPFDPDGCPDDMECGYCRDGQRTALYAKKCLNGSKFGGTDPLQCTRDCPADLSGYYSEEDLPANKEIVDSCQYYSSITFISGIDEMLFYTTYYKVGSFDCPSTYTIIPSDCTFGPVGTKVCQKANTKGGSVYSYVFQCQGEDNTTNTGCVGDFSDNWLEASYNSMKCRGSTPDSSCVTCGSGIYFDKDHTCTYNGVTYYHSC